MKDQKAQPEIVVTILGFSRTPSGLRLNTSPSLEIWVNSRKEYDTYKENIGKEVEFTPRTIKTRAGLARKVYDMNIKEVDEADLEELFTPNYDDGGVQETEDVPF